MKRQEGDWEMKRVEGNERRKTQDKSVTELSSVNRRAVLVKPFEISHEQDKPAGQNLNCCHAQHGISYDVHSSK